MMFAFFNFQNSKKQKCNSYTNSITQINSSEYIKRFIY